MGFWSTLGKIGAGVAAPFTGGASLAAIPLISGAEAKSKGGSFWKGAAAGLPEAALGMVPGLGAVGGAAGSAGKAATGGILSKLGGVPGGGRDWTQLASDIGGILGKSAEGSAQQRIQEAPALIGAQNANVNAADTAFKNQLAGLTAQQGLDSQMRKNAMLAAMLGNLQDAGVSKPANSTIPNFEITGGLRPSAITGGGAREALLALLGGQQARLMTPGQVPTYQGPGQMEMPTAGTAEKLMGAGGILGQILGTLGKSPVPQTPPFVPRTTPGPQTATSPTPGPIPETAARMVPLPIDELQVIPKSPRVKGPIFAQPYSFGGA